MNPIVNDKQQAQDTTPALPPSRSRRPRPPATPAAPSPRAAATPARPVRRLELPVTSAREGRLQRSRPYVFWSRSRKR